jgi:periplasmic protein TonB
MGGVMLDSPGNSSAPNGDCASLLFNRASGEAHCRPARGSTLISACLHAGAIVLIVSLTRVPDSIRQRVAQHLFIPLDLTPFRTVLPRAQHGGGGGGQRDATPARFGMLPRLAPREFVAPTTHPPAAPAPIMFEPAILGDAPPPLQPIDLSKLGSPTGVHGGDSGGRGSGNGIGDGDGGGVGDKAGPGYGDGPDGVGTEGGPGGPQLHTTAPVLLWKTEPEYSEDARRAKLQGMVVVRIQIDAEGRPRNPKVLQSLGLGLDERATDTVMHWKFRAATRNGRPVPSVATVEVSFRLL